MKTLRDKFIELLPSEEKIIQEMNSAIENGANENYCSILATGKTLMKTKAIEAFDKVMEEDNYLMDDLEERITNLSTTCIELSKRAVYTNEEKEKYWEFVCKCGFEGLSLFVLGGGQIADTGDYGNCYCPACGEVAD